MCYRSRARNIWTMKTKTKIKGYPLSVLEAKKVTQDIKGFISKGDYGAAHHLEDELQRWFVETIANYFFLKKDIENIAIVIHELHNIDYPRCTLN